MEIQKAKHLHLELDKKGPVINEAMVFEKYDGWFGYLDFPSCVINSRKHREIPALRELSNELRKTAPKVQGRLVFEIMIDGLEIDSFHILNGILNRKDEQAEDVYIIVHDFIPNWQFCEMEFSRRYNFAAEIVAKFRNDKVKLAPGLAISNKVSDWYAEAEKIWAKGGEGIIIKDIKGKYEPGRRVPSLMKIKEEVTKDFKVVRVIEGEGDHVGQVGAIICVDSLGNTHSIGMGVMTHEDGRKAWNGELELVGKVVEIKAMKELKDGSLREPRFKAIRYDKGVDEID